MVGQVELLKKVNNLTLKTLPHSNLLIGPSGSGRKTLVGIISNKFNLPLVDLTKTISQETIMETYLTPITKMYIIDADLILKGNKVEMYENALLKFLEEPPKSAYIFIICKNPSNLLPTIVNRCTQWKFAPYSEEELKNFSIDEDVLKIAHTPGQILAVVDLPIADITAFAKKVLSGIVNPCTFSKALRITKRISFKNDIIEKDKYPVKVFMSVITECAKDLVVKYPDNERAYKAYLVTNEINNKMNVAYADTDYLFDQYLIKLKVALDGIEL